MLCSSMTTKYEAVGAIDRPNGNKIHLHSMLFNQSILKIKKYIQIHFETVRDKSGRKHGREWPNGKEHPLIGL